MKPYDETEQAYKNGYEAGVKELAERLKNCLFDRDNDTIDNITEQLIDKQRKGDKRK